MATEQKEITDPCAKYNEQTSFLSKTIFASRWLQVPIYLGLIVVQGIYAYKFMKNLWYLITNVNEMDAFYVNYQHFVYSLIANLCECLKNS